MRFLKTIVNAIGYRRAQGKLRTFERHIFRGERALDIGTGGGWIGEKLQEHRDAEVTLLDVADLNQTSLPLTLYKGDRMPFDNASFDVCLLILVLHHCDNPVAVLKEAARVSRDRIVILEDTFRSKAERALVCAQDLLTNAPRFFVTSSTEGMPYQFKSVEEWEKVFEELGLVVAHKEEGRNFFARHVVFVLKK